MKNDTHMRGAITVQEKVALTIRFLATGDSYTSLQYLFKISKQAISETVPHVCQAIIEALQNNIKVPTTEDNWLAIAKGFEELWNYPHLLGAMDGKHIVLQAPFNSGTEFFNYKTTFSVVLLALVDAHYNFIYVDVGCQGRISDGGVYRNSALYKKIENNALNFPKPQCLGSREKEIPYFFVGDEAFALSPNMMKGYAGMHPKGSKERVFNYRTSRALRVVENVFGICSSVFRVLRKPLILQENKAALIVMAVAHLHNFLRRNKEAVNIYTPLGTLDYEDEEGNVIPGTWRAEQHNLTSLITLRHVPRRSSTTAKDVREELSDYFMNEGSVSWQNNYA
ncbi:uncharacterized protein [Palaemon carinicauda]|uniref:uncharacterized protein n=1 Tax=Palaemon carinicauda TaxID=392227 RepID=UPI0035B5ACAE